MKPIRTTNFLLILFLGIVLSTGTVYGKNEPIEDQNQINLVDPGAFYDYKDTGLVHGSGAYFNLNVGVFPAEYLSDYNDVIEMMAIHLETERQFSMTPDQCTNYLELHYQSWYVMLRPEGWMFQGPWRFIMVYNGSDGKMHQQFIDTVPGPKVYPPKPSEIKIPGSSYPIVISWAAIGDPGPTPRQFDYRIRVYDADGICAVKDLRWYYDSIKNRVISYPIDATWSKHRVRLENRQYEYVGDSSVRTMSRATVNLILP